MQPLHTMYSNKRCLRWRVHLIIKCYYSLVTNSIYERDVANNYIHLRAKEKMSAFQNDQDRRSPLSSSSNCPQTKVMANLNGKKVYVNWNEQLSRSGTPNCIKFTCVFNQVHLQTARGAVLFTWKSPDHSILVPIWKICLWVWREPRLYRWDYACKTLTQLSIATIVITLLNGSCLTVHKRFRENKNQVQESWKRSLQKQESTGSYC